MSYLVLARKYRPSGFDDIIGQQHVVQTLRNAIELKRVHHAFLFTGARGVGKTTTARVLARALNCSSGPTINPCGSCAQCVEIAQGTSPDVFEIDGASNTSVDNVRDLRENVRYLPASGRFKIYIIDEVHMLSQAAFNALLKTLEEPPAHVKFIFATTEPHKIPITILSRCQRFDFRRVSTRVLCDHVRSVLGSEGVELAPGAITAIVRESGGSVRDALSLTDQVLSFTGGRADEAAVALALGVVDRQAIFDLATAMLARDAHKTLVCLAELDSRGHDLGEVAALLVAHIRDLTVVQAVENPSEALLDRSVGEIEALRAQGQGHSRAYLHRLFSQSVAVAEDVARSPFQRISLEMGVLRLMEIAPTHDVQTLLERLDALVSGEAMPPSPSAAKKKVLSPPEEEGAGGAHTLVVAPAVASPEVAPPVAPDVPAACDHDAWADFVAALHKSKPLLASLLGHARMQRFGALGVELGFAQGTIFLEAVRESDNITALKEALAQRFGCPVPLLVMPLQGDAALAAASIVERRATQTRERIEELRDEALRHPAVTNAIAVMGGEVEEVLTLDPTLS